jgi:hypothetical protein
MGTNSNNYIFYFLFSKELIDLINSSFDSEHVSLRLCKLTFSRSLMET